MGSYVSTFFPQTFTLENYTRLFTDTAVLNFPQMFMKHPYHCGVFLPAFQLLCAVGILLSVPDAL